MSILENLQNLKLIHGASLNDLSAMADSVVELISHIENYKDVISDSTKIVNTIAPKNWEHRYRGIMASRVLDGMKYDLDSDGIRKAYEIFEEKMKGKEEAFEKMSQETAARIMGIIKPSTPKEMASDFDNMTEEEVEKATYKLPVKLKNVMLYHGTSYENYLKIKETGIIRATDYSEGDFAGKNLNRIYKKESGYVFCSDCIDFPMSLSFGGYKKNSNEWAFGNEKSKPSFLNNIGAVLVVDPSSYDTFYYGQKRESEFLISGDVSIADVRDVLFYKVDYEDDGAMSVKQISEEDIRI